MIGQEDSEQVQLFWVKLPTQVPGSSQEKGGPVKGGSQFNDKVHKGSTHRESKGLQWTDTNLKEQINTVNTINHIRKGHHEKRTGRWEQGAYELKSVLQKSHV